MDGCAHAGEARSSVLSFWHKFVEPFFGCSQRTYTPLHTKTELLQLEAEDHADKESSSSDEQEEAKGTQQHTCLIVCCLRETIRPEGVVHRPEDRFCRRARLVLSSHRLLKNASRAAIVHLLHWNVNELPKPATKRDVSIPLLVATGGVHAVLQVRVALTKRLC